MTLLEGFLQGLVFKVVGFCRKNHGFKVAGFCRKILFDSLIDCLILCGCRTYLGNILQLCNFLMGLVVELAIFG